MKAQPFKPIRISLADGRGFMVQHPEFVARSPSGRTITVYESDESSADIDMLLVVSLDYLPTNGKHKRK